MKVEDLQRVRFARSPLTEAAESLWILISGKVQPIQQGWYRRVRGRLETVDLDLLRTVVPGTGIGLADFLLPSGEATTIEEQLRSVAELPTERLAANLHRLWPDGLPTRAGALLTDPAGARSLADALWHYWTIGLAPYWDRICAVIDGDIAFRAAALTRHGAADMFNGLHAKVGLTGDLLRLNMTHTAERQLDGGGMRLVPSVFSWPYIVFDIGATRPNSLVYPARGLGDLWHRTTALRPDDPLAKLLGRTRAAVLTALVVPGTTTGLARLLDQCPPAISQHVSVLRRSNLIVSRRSGRNDWHEQTQLGRSIAAAGSSDG